jgi:radical SAM protein with 4Fe4S-binding SPASM domain
MPMIQQEFFAGLVESFPEFHPHKKIVLPTRVSYYYFKKTHLLVASESRSWITPSDIGYHLYQNLRKGLTLEQSVINTKNERNLTNERILHETKALLTEIKTREFFESTKNAVFQSQKPEINLLAGLTNQCPLKCIHCLTDSGKKLENELTLREWKRCIEEYSLVGDYISFYGGEPLCSEILFDVAGFSNDLGLKTTLFSGGTLIDQSNVGRIAETFSVIQLSLDGASAEINDRIRGSGVFDKVINALALLKPYSSKRLLSICVLPENIEDLESNLVQLAKDLEVEIILDMLVDTGRGKRLAENYNVSDIAYRTGKIRNKLAQSGHGSSFAFSPLSTNCRFGSYYYLAPNGDFYPCPKPQISFGNVRKDSLGELIKKMEDQRREIDQHIFDLCQSCDLHFICKGGCLVDNKAMNGDCKKVYCPPEWRDATLHMLLVAERRTSYLSLF